MSFSHLIVLDYLGYSAALASLANYDTGSHFMYDLVLLKVEIHPLWTNQDAFQSTDSFSLVVGQNPYNGEQECIQLQM